MQQDFLLLEVRRPHARLRTARSPPPATEPQTSMGSATMDSLILRPTTMTFRPSPARPSAALLRESRPLKSLFGQAQQLVRLQHLLDSQLQPAARGHCHVASWREGCLLLIVTDGQWATRLRYQQRRLQRQLLTLEAFRGLSRLLFKVRPPMQANASSSRVNKLSPAAAESLRTAAEGIDDPRLRAALKRLARHGRPD